MANQNRHSDDGRQRQQPAKRDEKAVSKIVLQAQKEFSVIAASDKLLDWAKEAGFAQQMIAKNYKLATADEQSIVNAVVNVASVGLSLNPVTGFAIIVPRWSKQLGNNEASLMIPYKGLLKLATDVGLDDFTCENVYSQDTFRYWVDDDGAHVHYEKNHMVRQDTEDNYYVLTFVRAKFKSYAGVFIEVVPEDEMVKIRAMSDGYDEKDPGCVWIKWAGEQRKKAALKRGQKRWPKTSSKEWERLEKAIAIDNEVEGAKLREREKQAEAEDGEIIEKVTAEQLAEIVRLCHESGVSPYRLGMAYKIKADNTGKGLEALNTDQYAEIIERLKAAAEEKHKRDADEGEPQ